MKQIIIQAAAIPGTPRQQAMAEAIEYAKEQDALVEFRIDGIMLHVLPESTIEQLEATFQLRS